MHPDYTLPQRLKNLKLYVSTQNPTVTHNIPWLKDFNFSQKFNIRQVLRSLISYLQRNTGQTNSYSVERIKSFLKIKLPNPLLKNLI